MTAATESIDTPRLRNVFIVDLPLLFWPHASSSSGARQIDPKAELFCSLLDFEGQLFS